MKTSYKIYIGGLILATAGIVFISWKRRPARVAEQFLDQQEIGNNQGFANRAFQAMLSSIGWISGEAWCMFFAKSVLMNAYPKRSAKINSILNGSTQASLTAARANPDVFDVITSGKPHVGDIVIWQSVTNPALGHAGIVRKNLGYPNYGTVEGNTNFEGARDGQGVTNQQRNLTIGAIEGSLKVIAFIRVKPFI